VNVEVLRQQLVAVDDVAADAAVPADVLRALTGAGAGAGAGADDDERRLLQREVDLCRGTDGVPLVYASSWWTIDAAKRFNILQARIQSARVSPAFHPPADRFRRSIDRVTRVQMADERTNELHLYPGMNRPLHSRQAERRRGVRTRGVDEPER